MTTSSFLNHLNNSGCVIKQAEGKRRGVYGALSYGTLDTLITMLISASRVIPRHTTVEISPVLYLSKEEYEEHGKNRRRSSGFLFLPGSSIGKHTVPDPYTFKWPDGRMALALGLGTTFDTNP